MISIIKKKNKISRDLLSKIEWACRLNYIKIEHQMILEDCLRVIEHTNLIELLKNFLCVFDKNYNKNRMVTLEYNMDVFILSKVMEMNETEKESFVFELFYNLYCIILQKQ